MLGCASLQPSCAAGPFWTLPWLIAGFGTMPGAATMYQAGAAACHVCCTAGGWREMTKAGRPSGQNCREERCGMHTQGLIIVTADTLSAVQVPPEGGGGALGACWNIVD